MSSLYIGDSTPLEQKVGLALDRAAARGVSVSVTVDGNRMARDGTLARPYVTRAARRAGGEDGGEGLLGEIRGVHHVKYLRADDEIMVGGGN